MPQVPYSPVPDIRPTEGGPGPLRVETPQAAFGGAVAHAIEGFGKGLEHAGDEIFQRAVALQQLQNQTDANNAKVQFANEADNIRTQFGVLEGNNATAALPKLQKDLDAARERVRGSLPNDMTRKMY